MTAFDGLRESWEAVPKERPAVLWLKDGIGLLLIVANVAAWGLVLWALVGAR